MLYTIFRKQKKRRESKEKNKKESKLGPDTLRERDIFFIVPRKIKHKIFYKGRDSDLEKPKTDCRTGLDFRSVLLTVKRDLR